MLLFNDRKDAGRKLAQQIKVDDPANTIVLGLARGGVPVAHEVSQALRTPLDVYIVRKIGAPGQEELALGAMSMDGYVRLNEEFMAHLGLGEKDIEPVITRERHELRRREKSYRRGRESLDIRGKDVIVIDDGLATGASMSVALESLQQHKPRKLIAAIPVASPEAVGRVKNFADDVIALSTPELFLSVGSHYRDFAQVTDEEVLQYLRTDNTPLKKAS